jgi:hypothetical protein
MRNRIMCIAGLAAFSTATLLADFQYQQTTKITGGMMAGMARFAGKQATEPVVNTVAVKGNRMAHVSAKTAQVIDLDKETITHIDFDKKTYSVMTFEQMKQMMQEAMQKMQGRQGNQGTGAEIGFQASVRQTGKSRDVNGINAQEYILTMAVTATDQQSGQGGAMNMTNDMWMAAEIPGFQEVKEFQRRMASKMGTMFGAGASPMQMMRPEMGKGMAEMAKEMSKLKGMPVMQVMRMGSTADGKPLPAASEAPELSQSQSQGPGVGDAAGRAAGGAATGAATNAAESRMGRLGGVAGGLGGLGGLGRKKPQSQDQAQAQAPQGAGAGGGVLMESTTEMSGFSSGPVDSAKFEVPAGFKQVQSDLEKRKR